MKKTWFAILDLPLACYAWACSSSSSGGNENNTDGGPNNGTDGGGNPGTDGGPNPGTDGGGPGTDSGTPTGTNPIQGVGTPKQLTMDVGGGNGYLDAPRYWGNALYVADPLINAGAGVQYTIDSNGQPTIYRQPSNGTTGTAIDSKSSTLMATEAVTKDVVHLLGDGGTVPITSMWDSGAGPLTAYDAPNDLTMRKSDGTIFFTDPGFQNNATTNHVFRIGPSGAVLAVDTCADACQPNGLAISPKEDFLYVGYSYTGGQANPVIKKFPLNANGTLGAGTTFVASPGAQVDGMAIDDNGNLYAAYQMAVAVYSSTGAKWGEIKLPGNVQPVHVAFGGADRKTLYIAAQANVFTVTVAVPGRVE
jgi:gluconolactonase